MTRAVPDHLHLGCGLTAPANWLNVDGSFQVMLTRKPWLKTVLVETGLLPRQQADIPWSPTVVRLNLAKPLPFPDDHFAAVYASHLLEHLHYNHGLALLRECHRVLRPGATCRVVVPDLEAIVNRYTRAKAVADPHAATRLMEELLIHDKAPRPGLLGVYYRLTAFHQHKWMYDAASLQLMFSSAGFGSVRRADYLDSGIARIAEVEDSGRVLNGQGICVEGVKA